VFPVKESVYVKPFTTVEVADAFFEVLVAG
jgi:hypothetical protein